MAHRSPVAEDICAGHVPFHARGAHFTPLGLVSLPLAAISLPGEVAAEPLEAFSVAAIDGGDGSPWQRRATGRRGSLAAPGPHLLGVGVVRRHRRGAGDGVELGERHLLAEQDTQRLGERGEGHLGGHRLADASGGAPGRFVEPLMNLVDAEELGRVGAQEGSELLGDGRRARAGARAGRGARARTQGGGEAAPSPMVSSP